MDIFLILACLFFVGSVGGWVLELFFRRFISGNNPERKWINPGFCTGPYLPLYGTGLCLLYLIAQLEARTVISDPFWNKAVLFLTMAVSMTAIEYLAGICSLKFAKVRLWDYSSMWGNIQGIICPLFSLAWAVLGGVYYFFVHPYILGALSWLAQNLAFSFFIGQFFGVFIIDVVHSAKLVARLKQFADENGVIVKYESIKNHIRSVQERAQTKYHFFTPFRCTVRTLTEHLTDLADSFEKHGPSKKASGQ